MVRWQETVQGRGLFLKSPSVGHLLARPDRDTSPPCPRKWDPSRRRRPGDDARQGQEPLRAEAQAGAPGIPEGVAILYGWHTVAAALANPRRTVRKIFATENAAHRLTEEGLTLPVTPEIVRPDAIAARLSPDAVHQGLLVEADPLPALDIEDVAGARHRAGARPDHRSA